MKIGCVSEIKKHEYRVGLTPQCVAAYVLRGHSVTMQAGAGSGTGFPDEEYVRAGRKSKKRPRRSSLYAT